MRIRIRYCKEITLAMALRDNSDSCHFEVEHEAFGNTRCTRQTLERLNVLARELDAAEADPGTWIDCPREEAPAETTGDLHVIIAERTQQRDALLKACRLFTQLGGIVEKPVSLDSTITIRSQDYRVIQEAVRTAIALTEPKTC